MALTHYFTVIQFLDLKIQNKSILDDFPKEMQSSVSKRLDGRFYQDFFKVIINAEQVDDWQPIAMTLKTNFNNYLSWIGCDEGGSKDIPLCTNSRATDGNVLEAVNISLNGEFSLFVLAN